MPHYAAIFSSVALYLPLAFAVASFGYYVAVSLAAILFLSEPEPSADYTPPVTVLKPLHGLENDLHACLVSHFQQDYPRFELIFGTSRADDPALALVKQLCAEYPRIPVQVVVVPELRRANPKMNNLERMIERASHEHVVINDADILVPPDYLRKIIRPLAEESVGMVTCLYRGTSARGFGAILEAVGITGEFAGQVLLGRWVEGMHFALGATMATRKRQIAAIGGLGCWADYLADDYILGNRIAAAGFRIHLSHEVVATTIAPRTISSLFHQQIRWAKTIRISRPHGYPGLLLAYGVPISALAWCFRPDSFAAASAFLGLLAVRLTAASICGKRVCRDPMIVRYLWLIPLRDALSLLVWVASFFGRTVTWRGIRFRVENGGKITPA